LNIWTGFLRRRHIVARIHRRGRHIKRGSIIRGQHILPSAVAAAIGSHVARTHHVGPHVRRTTSPGGERDCKKAEKHSGTTPLIELHKAL
jgi:hypothetical protein